MTATDGLPTAPGTSGPSGAAVLFDIDDTLVDLAQAMGRTLREIPDPTLGHLGEDDWVRYAHLYTADPERHYDRFLAGDLTFQEQRVHRIRHARAPFTREPFVGTAVDDWVLAYEQMLPRHFRTFDDVTPLLDVLDEKGVPYGAVSNNTYAYQRAKLDRAGLGRMKVLVGIDTVGVAKPAPGIFREGVRLLGSDLHRTVYVGDNRQVDALGARDAGLIGVWLDRTASSGPTMPAVRPGRPEVPVGEVPTISSLLDVLEFLPLFR